MKILIAGASGYIGSHLLRSLTEAGHHIYALARHPRKSLGENVTIIKADLLERESLQIPEEIDIAFYLVHSMGKQARGFYSKEEASAENFREALAKTKCRQIIYLSGLSHGEILSEHMRSRRNVEKVLRQGSIPVTILRAAIIIGEGSASFEIIRDLVEKLPIMITPRWVNSLCQPIAIDDVIGYLHGVMDRKECLDKTFEIGGPEVLSYREVLLGCAKVRDLRRWIIPVPVLSPRLSSYWLIFITSTSFPLACALVESLKHDVVCEEHSIQDVIPLQCMSYKEALQHIFDKKRVPTRGCKKKKVQWEVQPQNQLILYKKMAIFGEKWMEIEKDGCVTITFRPKGLLGYVASWFMLHFS